MILIAFGSFVLLLFVGVAFAGFAWATAWRFSRDDERADNLRRMLWCKLKSVALPAIFCVWVGGWLALGLAVTLLFLPVAGYAPEILHKKRLPPMYSRAIARMKFGKYSEAEQEVLRQLENCENDFTGWLMLADLYANHFSDLAEAEQTILEICEHPKTTPSQLAVALHRLAD